MVGPDAAAGGAAANVASTAPIEIARRLMPVACHDFAVSAYREIAKECGLTVEDE
jgi:hypothetical protein